MNPKLFIDKVSEHLVFDFSENSILNMMAHTFPTLGQILFLIALCNCEEEWNSVHDINQVVQNVTLFLVFQILTLILITKNIHTDKYFT